jgi:HEAT repeat protein
MKTKRIALALIMAAAVTAAAQAQQPVKRTHTAAEIEPLLEKIAKYEHGQSRVPVADLTLFMEESLDSPALLKQLEARLLQFLQSGATSAGKEIALRELSLIASDASIPLLSGMLLQPQTAGMARFALARIPGPAADEALRTALAKSSGNTRIGIINSLGLRRDARSVTVLQPLMAGADPGLAAAAAGALSNIANQPAVDALAAARAKAAGVTRQRISEAYMFAAAQLAARGDTAAALKIYKDVLRTQEPTLIRIAALNGLTAHDGKSSVPVLIAELGSTDAGLQAAAIRLLSGLPGAEVTNALMQQYPKLQPPAQVRLMAVLGARGDVAAKELVMNTARNSTGEVRASALAALGKIGDAASVSLLADAAATAQGAQQQAARSALRTLRGKGIDEAIVAAIQSSTGKVKAELILAAGERATAGAGEAVIKSARDSDPDVRRESLRALKSIAGPSQAPALVGLLVQSSSAADRREAVQTLAAVLKKSQTVSVTPVMEAYRINSDLQTRLALMEVMGLVSSQASLPLLRASLKDSSPEIARGAILALTQWSTAEPLEDLLAVARGETNPALQVLGLRGYLKLLALPSNRRPAGEGAKMLAEAWSLAKQVNEKQAVLSQLPLYPSKESLQIAEAAMTDQEVAREAKAAADRLRVLLKSQ